MKRRALFLVPLSVPAIGLLIAGCGGTEPPIGAPDAMPQSRALATHAEHSRSWMLPEAQGRDLLYVNADYQGYTDVYTYPQGRLVGSLGNTGYSGGLCSNASGDVFITTQYGIYEYPHARAVPVATLTDPLGDPSGCSVDPTTGKLAVSGDGGVVVYKPELHHQWHVPKVFSFYNIGFTSCAYDDNGDLFVDGELNGSESYFAELPKGAKQFADMTLNQSVGTPGNMEWDGKYLAVGDEDNLLIHRFAIEGTQGTQVGLLTLDGATLVGQFWIQRSALISGAYESAYFVGFWSYPQGGSTTKQITQGNAYGATVSVVRRK